MSNLNIPRPVLRRQQAIDYRNNPPVLINSSNENSELDINTHYQYTNHIDENSELDDTSIIITNI